MKNTALDGQHIIHRPGRFGKTLNLSMLRSFFEDTMNTETNAQNRELFQGLKIMTAGEEYTRMYTGKSIIMAFPFTGRI